jgi:hypothetical protein
MKQIILIIFTLLGCNLFAQDVDTLDIKIKVRYSYIHEGSKHYYVMTTTYQDSSKTIQMIPFTSKEEMIEFANKQVNDADGIVASINRQIEDKESIIMKINNEVMQYADSVNAKINELRSEIKNLKTQRHLVIESKRQLQ